MAKNKFMSGAAVTTAQVNTETPATVEIDDIFKVKLGNRGGESNTLSFTATAATVQNVVEGLKALAVAAATAGVAPWDEVTCTEDDTKMTITADVAGEPFYVTTSTVDGGGNDTQTLTDANTTPCAGPHIYADDDNWSLDLDPAVLDDVSITAELVQSTHDIYGYDSTGDCGNGINTFYIEDGCPINIGSEERPLKIKVDTDVRSWGTGTIHLHVTEGAGAGHEANVYVFKAGKGAAAGKYNFNLTGATIDALYVQVAADEKVGIASQPGNTITCPVICIKNGIVKIGNGVTGTTLTVEGGVVECWADIATVNVKGGIVHMHGQASTALNVTGGICYYYHAGDDTIATLTIGGEGAADFSRDSRSRTITNAVEMSRGATLYDPENTTTAVVVKLNDCRIDDVSIDIGRDKTLTVS